MEHTISMWNIKDLQQKWHENKDEYCIHHYYFFFLYFWSQNYASNAIYFVAPFEKQKYRNSKNSFLKRIERGNNVFFFWEFINLICLHSFVIYFPNYESWELVRFVAREHIEDLIVFCLEWISNFYQQIQRYKLQSVIYDVIFLGW